MKAKLLIYGLVLSFAAAPVRASEVVPESSTHVSIQENASTGKPLVTITADGRAGSRYEFLKNPQNISRPDYAMLDPNRKTSDFNYDGPYSSRTKVYVFAASVAAAGLAAGTLLPVSATAGGAAGSAGAFAAAGTAVAAAPLATAYIRSRPDPNQNDFEHKAETVLIRDYRGANGETL